MFVKSTIFELSRDYCFLFGTDTLALDTDVRSPSLRLPLID